MKTTIRVCVVLLAAVAAACTNKEGQSEAPVSVTVTLPQQPLSKSISDGAPLTITTITLNSHLKDPTATDPQHFADVQLNTYTVSFARHDGGTLLPPAEQFSAALLLPSGGSVSLTGFPIISTTTLQRSPFDQLLPFNGGVDRETGLSQIHLFYSITFFGNTVSGFRVQSQTATGDVFIVP